MSEIQNYSRWLNGLFLSSQCHFSRETYLRLQNNKLSRTKKSSVWSSLMKGRNCVVCIQSVLNAVTKVNTSLFCWQTALATCQFPPAELCVAPYQCTLTITNAWGKKMNDCFMGRRWPRLTLAAGWGQFNLLGAL